MDSCFSSGKEVSLSHSLPVASPHCNRLVVGESSSRLGVGTEVVSNLTHVVNTEIIGKSDKMGEKMERRLNKSQNGELNEEERQDEAEQEQEFLVEKKRRIHHRNNNRELSKEIQITQEHPEREDNGDDKKEIKEKKGGRKKINIEFIENKSRRHVTFSKRKAGLIKKAYELSTLTGTQVLLLVASETGNVYTFATPKLQPLITKPEGKTLIQSCLNPSETHEQPSTSPESDTSPTHQGEPETTEGYNEEKQKGSTFDGYPMSKDVQSHNMWNSTRPERLNKDQKGGPGLSEFNNYNSYTPTNAAHMMSSNYSQYPYAVSNLSLGYHGMVSRPFPYHHNGGTLFNHFNGALHHPLHPFHTGSTFYYPTASQFSNTHLPETNAKDSMPNM